MCLESGRMDHYLQRLLSFYQKTSERAGVSYRCLTDEGSTG